MSKSETRRRSELIGVRLSPVELAEAERFAAAAGLTVAELIRRLLADCAIGAPSGGVTR